MMDIIRRISQKRQNDCSVTIKAIPPEHFPRTSVILAIVILLASTQVSSQEKGIIYLNGSEIAEKTYVFIDSFKRENSSGLYNYRRFCGLRFRPNGGCAQGDETYPSTGSWAVLAQASRYRLTGDERYKKDMVQSMAQLRKNCPPTDKSNCNAGGVQAERAYEITGDDSYLDYLRNGTKDQPSLMASINASAMMQAIVGRQDAILYRIKGEGDPFDALFYIRMAEDTEKQVRTMTINGQVFTNYQAVLLSKKNRQLRQDSCWIQLAKMDLYLATKDKPNLQGKKKYGLTMNSNQLLGETLSFFNDLDLGAQYRYELENGTHEFPTLTTMQPCAEALLMAYNITGNKKYKSDALTILELFANNYWDSDYSKIYTGDNLFVSQQCWSFNNTKHCYEGVKIPSDNGYAVYLYSMVADSRIPVYATRTTKLYEDRVYDKEYTWKPGEYHPNPEDVKVRRRFARNVTPSQPPTTQPPTTTTQPQPTPQENKGLWIAAVLAIAALILAAYVLKRKYAR